MPHSYRWSPTANQDCISSSYLGYKAVILPCTIKKKESAWQSLRNSFKCRIVLRWHSFWSISFQCYIIWYRRVKSRLINHTAQRTQENIIYHYIKWLTFRNILLFLTTLYETLYQKALDNNDTDIHSILCLCSFSAKVWFSWQRNEG
jgi:hypothetical protein